MSKMVKKSDNLKKPQKISFFSTIFFVEEKKKNCRKKEKNAILLVFQYYEDAIRPELSSLPRFGIQGGPLSVTKDERTEILVSNIG